MAAVARAPDLPPLLQDGLAYLRNWNHAYDRASIAASIFDTWVRTFYDRTHRWPEPADSTSRPLLVETLAEALATLTRTHGPDLSRWRWETVQPDLRYVPPWTDTTATATIPYLFRPVRRPGTGHPTTPAWGASPPAFIAARPGRLGSLEPPPTRAPRCTCAAWT
ncbi:MAG: hypothetical protein KatS3mg044_1161 [Rhodothermaceae bacterium]|nr:MAG: hypothetical protein KatS3mg044_1161 [Rhodothermaceae bacterium]